MQADFLDAAMKPIATARSPWVRGRTPTAGPLEGNVAADVCIAGSGAAGLTAGLLLAREGRSVIILDEEGPEDSGAITTTAHLTSAVDDRISTIARLHGTKKARMVVDCLEKAIDRVEETCRTEGIPGFRRVDGPAPRSLSFGPRAGKPGESPRAMRLRHGPRPRAGA